MSKPLFEFVKVAAGEPFPWPSGDYALKVENGQLTTNYTKFQQVFPVDAYYLRPAESPDAGREAWINAKQCPPPKVQWRHVDGIGGGINYWYDVVLNAYRIDNIEWRLLPSELDPRPTPATNVGDIPAGREEEPIMFQTENPNGLHQRYHVEKITAVLNNGIRVTKPVDLGAEYFVMRLDSGGSDPKHIEACRKAVNNYADNIEPHLPELAADLRRRYPVTPADPGSQVEAGKFAEWLSERGWGKHIAQDWWTISFGSEYTDGCTTADLITLYKQSL